MCGDIRHVFAPFGIFLARCELYTVFRLQAMRSVGRYVSCLEQGEYHAEGSISAFLVFFFPSRLSYLRGASCALVVDSIEVQSFYQGRWWFACVGLWKHLRRANEIDSSTFPFYFSGNLSSRRGRSGFERDDEFQMTLVAVIYDLG